MIITSCKTYGTRGGKTKAQRKDSEPLYTTKRLFMQSDEIKSYLVGFQATDDRTYTIEISPEEWKKMKQSFDRPISAGNWFRRAED